MGGYSIWYLPTLLECEIVTVIGGNKFEKKLRKQ